jgi:glutaredoxin 3
MPQAWAHTRTIVPTNGLLDTLDDNELPWPNKENVMAKSNVEVFTAGCPVCEPAVQMVEDLAGPDDDVTVYDLHETDSEKVSQYGITTLPAVVVDGTIVSCCDHPGPDREQLRLAGVGQPLPTE